MDANERDDDTGDTVTEPGWPHQVVRPAKDAPPPDTVAPNSVFALAAASGGACVGGSVPASQPGTQGGGDTKTERLLSALAGGGSKTSAELSAATGIAVTLVSALLAAGPVARGTVVRGGTRRQRTYRLAAHAAGAAGTKTARLLAALSQATKPMTSAALHAVTGVASFEVPSLLNWCVLRGTVVRGGTRRQRTYLLAEQVAAAPADASAAGRACVDAAADFSCAMTSQGELVIESQGHRLALPPAHTQQLMHFIGQAGRPSHFVQRAPK